MDRRAWWAIVHEVAAVGHELATKSPPQILPYLLNLYAEYITRNTGLDEAQGGIKIARRNINNLRHAEVENRYLDTRVEGEDETN